MTAFTIIVACIAFVLVAGIARNKPGRAVGDMFVLLVWLASIGIGSRVRKASASRRSAHQAATAAAGPAGDSSVVSVMRWTRDCPDQPGDCAGLARRL